MCNHSTLVLGYLLLYGYDVSGGVYVKRLEALIIGALITGIIYFRNHRKKTHENQNYDSRGFYGGDKSMAFKIHCIYSLLNSPLILLN